MAKILSELKGLGHIADARNNGVRNKLGSVKDCSGALRTERQGIVDAFAEFYEKLYSSRGGALPKQSNQNRGKPGEIVRIEPEEVRRQLAKMKRKKAADAAGIVAEMLKDGGIRVAAAIAGLFNDVLEMDGPPPASWKECRIKVLFKKGDEKLLENYRPITIIPILYKLFSRILNERIKPLLEKEQSVDQAGFRTGFGCDDQMFAVAMITEKSAEWQNYVWMAAVDFKKAFDCVEHFAIWDALRELGVPERYVTVLMAMYDGQQGMVCEDKESRWFNIGRGTKQGDPISPQLFNVVFEVVFRKLKEKWGAKRWGLRMNTVWPMSHLTNLRFADDVLLVTNTLPQLTKMLGDLAEEARAVGLELHFGKTKILSNMQVRRGVSAVKQVTVAGRNVEVLEFEDSVPYLGREVSFKDQHDTEIQNRIRKAWAKFWMHKNALCSRHYSPRDRLRLFGAIITASILYGCGTWAMTLERERKIRTTQRK